MVENLRVRFFVIAALLLGCAYFLVWPISKGESPFNLGLDLRGGVELRFQLPDIAEAENPEEALSTTIEIFNNRLDSTGVREISTRSVGSDQIEVSIPGITSAEAENFKQVLSSIGRLEFRIAPRSLPAALDTDLGQEEQELIEFLDSLPEEQRTRNVDLSHLTAELVLGERSFRWIPISEKYEVDFQKYNSPQVANDRAGPYFMMIRYSEVEGEFVTGESIANVGASSDPNSGLPAVAFSVNPGRDASNFGKMTGNNEGTPMAIILDGEIQSAPNIDSKITTSGIITGGSNGFTQEELRRLIAVIRSGSLPQKPVLYSENEIGPTLGQIAISRGMIAGSLALGLVLVFMLIYYASTGLVACMALVVNMVLLLGVLAFLDATLTLPGIAGLVLTVGMAVDANILIFERIREELDKEKTVPQAVKAGFDRAFFTIIDANLTTILTAFFLYKFGTPTIRGFAVTLMIGIATSMFSALYFSRAIFAWWVAHMQKRLELKRLFEPKNFDFLRHRRTAGLVSLAAIVVGLVLFALQSDKKYGMDFTGGYEAQVRFAQPVAEADVGARVQATFPTADVIRVGGTNEAAEQFQIKVKKLADSVAGESGDEADVSSTFGQRVLAIFEGEADFPLPSQPLTDMELDEADAQGRRAVRAAVHYNAEVRKSDLESKLAQELSEVQVEGPEQSSDYQIAGLFARAPATVEQAEARILQACARMPATAGGGEVTLSNPLPSKTFVGPRAGSELRDSAIRAIFFSLLGIVLYIRVRFRQYRFGLAASLAVLHDVAITLGVVGLVHWTGLVEMEINLAIVAAFLTIIGYSLNDTIVIFDRVRENLPRMDGQLNDIFNRSINQTLSRTILTSITTLVVVAILFAFNVGQRNVLEGFAFALIIGIITGTYSTVFIASPAVLWIARRMEAKKAEAAAARA